MTRTNSAKLGRAASLVAAALALAVIASAAQGATTTPPSDPDIAVSLVQSATAVPLGGTMGFTGVIRLSAPASSVQARLQLRRSGGRLLYQRTQYLSTAEEGTQTFSFARPLEGLGLDTGSYPVTFSIHATIDGSDVSTDVTQIVRVYDPDKPPLPVIVLAKVHTRPLANPSGTFSIDPSATAAVRPRDEVDRIATLVSADPLARVSLAISPVTLEEWRRFASGGYTLASGGVVPPSDPTPVAYATTLAHLQQAIATGRLELETMGYADPNLADLAANKLAGDAGVQYDAGLSAIFASLETTPSAGTAPAGGCVPAAMQRGLLARHVAYAFVDGERARIGKRTGVASGVYGAADSTLTAIVVDARAGRGLESGDASATLGDTFDRAETGASQPLAIRIDLDDSVPDATATVGLALATIEGSPWMQLQMASQVRPPKGAKQVAFVPTATKRAPAEFWPTVRSARARAGGMLAALTSSDSDATFAQTESLISESSAWSDPAGKWSQAAAGLAYASSAIKTADGVFGAIKVSASPVTLAGATGQLPVSIQNNSKKTLTVLVVTKTSNGIRVTGSKAALTKLPPRETFIQVPIDMQSALYGKVTVEVMAGSVALAKQTVIVHRSYLDRLALIGGIVAVLGGMLGWIVLRVRRSPDIEDEEDDLLGEESLETQESGEYESVTDVDDGLSSARYTDSAQGPPEDRGSDA